jgi:hypothetical protein
MVGCAGQAKTSLQGSGCESFMGFLDMAALDIDPDKIASPPPGRQARRPAAHERVEHGGARFRELLDQPFHMRQTPGTGMPGRPRARLCRGAVVRMRHARQHVVVRTRGWRHAKHIGNVPGDEQASLSGGHGVGEPRRPEEGPPHGYRP